MDLLFNFLEEIQIFKGRDKDYFDNIDNYNL